MGPPVLRVARLEDAPRISQLMRDSVAEIFPAFHDERETAAAVEHIAKLDTTLIEDGTFYVHDEGGEIVACGGWSRRNKIYTGSAAGADDGRLLDPATEPAHVRAMFVRGDFTRRGSRRVQRVPRPRVGRRRLGW